MLFWGTEIILNPNWLPCRTETKSVYLGKLISDIFLAFDGGNNPRNGIWNHPVDLIVLLVRLWNCKQNGRRHGICMRKNGNSLHFNFILLPSTHSGQELSRPIIICCAVHFQIMLLCMLFQLIQTYLLYLSFRHCQVVLRHPSPGSQSGSDLSTEGAACPRPADPLRSGVGSML